MSRAPELDRRFPRVSARVRYGYRNHAPQLFGLILCSLFVGCVLLIGGSLGKPGGSVGVVPVPAPRPPLIPAQQGPMIHANLLGGYAFAYPRTWTVAEAGAETELASPDGETLVSFSSGEMRLIGDGGGELSGGMALIRSLGSIVEPSVLGAAWQEIAERYGVPVLVLTLRDPDFYHLEIECGFQLHRFRRWTRWLTAARLHSRRFWFVL